MSTQHEHPTIEQSLHSIALSLIELNKRQDRKSLQTNVQVARDIQSAVRQPKMPKRRPWWKKMLGII